MTICAQIVYEASCHSKLSIRQLRKWKVKVIKTNTLSGRSVSVGHSHWTGPVKKMEEDMELQRLTTLLKKRGSLKYIRELINKVEAEFGIENGYANNDDEEIRNGSKSTSTSSMNGSLPNTHEVLDTNKTEAGNGTSIKSPLKNEYIMRMIFDLCSVTTLKSCRLVSTEWRDFSFSSWRNKAVLRLKENGSTLHKGSELSFQRFVKHYRSENDKLQLQASPFKNYHLNLTGDCQDGKSVQVRKIVYPLARHVTLSSYMELICDFKRKILSKFQAVESLELKNCKLLDSLIPSRSQSQKSWNNLTYPNLKRLKIVNSTVDGRSDQRIWTALLRCLPNLESLYIRSFRRDSGIDFIFVGGFLTLLGDKINLETCRTAVQDLKSIPLKELEVWDMSQTITDIFDVITSYYFPLERLSLGMNASNGNPIISIDSVATRLHDSKFSDTLQYLRLSLCGRLPDQEDTDKTHWKPGVRKAFESLKELSLAPALPQGFYFLSLIDAPKLEKLSLKKGDEDPKDPMPISVSFVKTTSFESLHTLEFQDNSKIPSPKLINALANIMPNLLKLTIPLDKHSFQIVCKRFTGLRSLNILHAQSDYEEIDDECLTGVPITMDDRPDMYPNITDLKDLTDFTISCERQLLRGDVGFTDHAVILGFLMLPRLHNLSIAFKKLSGTVKARLLAHVKGSVHIQEDVRTQVGQSHSGYFALEVHNDYDKDKDDDKHEKSKNSNSNENDSNETSDNEDEDEDDNGVVGAVDSASENGEEEESTDEEWQAPEEDDDDESIEDEEDEDLDGQIDSDDAENESSDDD